MTMYRLQPFITRQPPHRVLPAFTTWGRAEQQSEKNQQIQIWKLGEPEETNQNKFQCSLQNRSSVQTSPTATGTALGLFGY
jgi:hypothetical protein